MSQYYGGAGPPYGQTPSAQNLQFYPSSYAQQGHAAAPSYGAYTGPIGFGGPSSSGGSGGGGGSSSGFDDGVSGRMGEQGGLRTGWLAAFSTEGYAGEPPLLEELGVNFDHIGSKTLAVLNPFARVDQHLMDGSDLAGPILFFLLFGTFLLLSGKVHFGYIYGLALLGSTSLHLIFSLMSPSLDTAPHAAGDHGPSAGVPAFVGGGGGVGGLSSAAAASSSRQQHHHDPTAHLSGSLTLARSASILGYCLLPLVATSLLGVVLAMNTPAGISITSLAIVWCTYSASGIFCAVGRMRGMRALAAYPLALFYVGFGIMSVFSSKGSGLKVAAGQAGVL